MHGADRAHGRLVAQQADRGHVAPDGRRRGSLPPGLRRHLGLELAGQPKHQQHHAGREGEQDRQTADPPRPRFEGQYASHCSFPRSPSFSEQADPTPRADQ
jgi:hypothetical protein